MNETPSEELSRFPHGYVCAFSANSARDEWYEPFSGETLRRDCPFDRKKRSIEARTWPISFDGEVRGLAIGQDRESLGARETQRRTYAEGRIRLGDVFCTHSQVSERHALPAVWIADIFCGDERDCLSIRPQRAIGQCTVSVADSNNDAGMGPIERRIRGCGRGYAVEVEGCIKIQIRLEDWDLE